MTPGPTKGSDNPCRRSGIERRKFIYTRHIPEERKGKDRRLKEYRKTILQGLKNNLEKMLKDFFK